MDQLNIAIELEESLKEIEKNLVIEAIMARKVDFEDNGITMRLIEVGSELMGIRVLVQARICELRLLGK